MKTVQLVHEESWVFPQDERHMAQFLADQWRGNRLMVWTKEDTDSIAVKSLQVLEFEYDPVGDAVKELIKEWEKQNGMREGE